jgi:hypothetical protein
MKLIFYLDNALLPLSSNCIIRASFMTFERKAL